MVVTIQEEMKDPLTSHPRFVRYLGTCFNPSKLEAYVITDYAVGCTLDDMMRNAEIREAMDMTEEGKVRAAADLADAVYFLHGHSRPIAHGAISTASVVVDGETHRGKLVARQGAERLKQLVAIKGLYLRLESVFDPRCPQSQFSDGLQQAFVDLSLAAPLAARAEGILAILADQACSMAKLPI